MPSAFRCMPFLACNRQVDALDRRQCNLQAVPHDIERYARSLEELLLDMNHIRDLPKSLFRLHKLQRLGLSDNDIHRLPAEVAALHNLVELNLSRNDISDLPEDLKVCHNLQVLDISSNPIARLPDSITLCGSLTQLSLNDISLTKLPQDLGRLGALRSLEARENHLRALPATIAELGLLQRLDLGQNELDELPSDCLGSLRSLQELYVDENSLERLPDDLLCCTRLEQLDASSNRLFQLPEQLGELGALADLTVSHNCLRELPNSIGRLKRLLVLKADDNTIDPLTPAIGGCTALCELYLQQNLISELPSSIGNLQSLHTLNLDRCALRRLPALLGECGALGVLSVRDNQLQELPMEIGKLSRLRVLDVCNNRLQHLPYTVNVLHELQALWISENQCQALLRLQQDTDPRTGIKVLTCYLLPQQQQQDANANGTAGASTSSAAASKAAFLGGPKVHFDAEHAADAEAGTSEFERKNTPHPKAQQPQHHHNRHKQSVDGHVAPRMEEHPQTIALTRKVSQQDHVGQQQQQVVQQPGGGAPSSSAPQPQQPRSALKYSSRAIIQQQQQQQQHQPPQPQQRQPQQQSQQQPKTVLFAGAGGASVAASAAGAGAECKLKRVNTPHYKSTRGAAGAKITAAAAGAPAVTQTQQASRNAPSGSGVAAAALDGMHVQAATTNNNSNKMPGRVAAPSVERMRVTVKRSGGAGGGGGLGLSIAGGIESTPFVDDDPGLFISKLVPGGAAERSGLRVGDKVLDINGTSMVGQRHQVAVQCIQQQQQNGDCELYIERRAITATTAASTATVAAKEPPVPPSSLPLPRAATSGSSTTLSSSANTSFPSALPPQVQAVQQQQQSPMAADLPLGDPQLDGVIEEVDLVRDAKHSLGLSIVGGVDHCSHPFGTPSSPGVFISRIAPSSPADATRRLRIGDRILRVGERDIARARHNDAVEVLKSAGRTLRLTVRHETQPPGLRVVVVPRAHGSTHPLGLSICGGIGSAPVNPQDRTDEGIFIERVERGGASDFPGSGLRVGTRILEVNEDSLLGCTKEEAAHIFRRAPSGPVRLLVCDGFATQQQQQHSPLDQQQSPLAQQPQQQSPPKPPMASVTVRASPGSSPCSPPGVGVPLMLGVQSPETVPSVAVTAPQSPNNSGSELYQNIVAVEGKRSEPKASKESPPKVLEACASVPLLATERQQQPPQPQGSTPPTRTGVTTFSSEPSPPKAQKQPPPPQNGTSNGKKCPPPVAPKPKTNFSSFAASHNASQSHQPQSNGVASSSATEEKSLGDFSTRLRLFQQSQQPVATTGSTAITGPNPPLKRPLLSSEDLAKLAEDQRMRNGDCCGKVQLSPMSPFAEGAGDNDKFDHILNDSPIPLPPSRISSIRTKKAENRFLQSLPSTTVAGAPQSLPSATVAAGAPHQSLVSQVALEQQRRQEWRQARMASLEAESQRVNQLLSDVSDCGRRPQQSPPSPKIQQEESTTTNGTAQGDDGIGAEKR